MQDNQQHEAHATSIHFRPGTLDDLHATFQIFLDSVADLVWRMGIQEGERMPTEEERAADLQRWRPLLEHITATADQYWVAEREGKLLGFARSVLRDGVRELTEFFVSPQAQSDGIGRELLARAMPPGASRTYIMATLDLRAQALYHKLGVYQLCAVYTFHQKRDRFLPTQPADQTREANGLTIITLAAEHIPLLAKLDQAIHGHTRDQDHAWLIRNRKGFLLMRDERAVGYGYVGDPFSGPFVMLHTGDFPAALAYAENIAHAEGFDSFGVDVPMLNRTVIKYLLGRGYQMSPFFCFYMCDQQPIHLDKTIITGPMIMI